MIRIATKDDYDLVKSFADELTQETVYSKVFGGYSLTPGVFHAYTTNLREKVCIVIQNKDEDPVGFAAFDTITWPYLEKEIKYARLSFIYIEPDSRKLGLMDEVLEAFEYWAKQVGCSYCTVGTKQPKKGYVKVESTYMKELK